MRLTPIILASLTAVATPVLAEPVLTGTLSLAYSGYNRDDGFSANYLTLNSTARYQLDQWEILNSQQNYSSSNGSDRITVGVAELGGGYRISPELSVGAGLRHITVRDNAGPDDSVLNNFAYVTYDTDKTSFGVQANIDNGTVLSYEAFGTVSFSSGDTVNGLIVHQPGVDATTDFFLSSQTQFGDFGVAGGFGIFQDAANLNWTEVSYAMTEDFAVTARYTGLEIAGSGSLAHWEIGGRYDMGNGLALATSYGEMSGNALTSNNRIISFAVSYDMGAGKTTAWDARSSLYAAALRYPLF